jgi:hypothetical protein
VVLSTHILQEVEAVCDRVLIVFNGRLVMDKKISELKTSERLLVTLDRSPGEAEPALTGTGGDRGRGAFGEPGGGTPLRVVLIRRECPGRGAPRRTGARDQRVCGLFA